MAYTGIMTETLGPDPDSLLYGSKEEIRERIESSLPKETLEALGSHMLIGVCEELENTAKSPAELGIAFHGIVVNYLRPADKRRIVVAALAEVAGILVEDEDKVDALLRSWHDETRAAGTNKPRKHKKEFTKLSPYIKPGSPRRVKRLPTQRELSILEAERNQSRRK